MAKDYAEMLRKAREGYTAATSGTTSGANKSGAKDYAKMLQDARNRVQGIQPNNDADAAQRASNARTVAARYYTNNLQYPGTVKKTPEQQSHDRVVYARQPAVQQQLKNRADMLNGTYTPTITAKQFEEAANGNVPNGINDKQTKRAYKEYKDTYEKYKELESQNVHDGTTSRETIKNRSELESLGEQLTQKYAELIYTAQEAPALEKLAPDFVNKTNEFRKLYVDYLSEKDSEKRKEKQAKMSVLGKAIENMATAHPGLYASKQTTPDGVTMYVPRSDDLPFVTFNGDASKLTSFSFGKPAYLSDRMSQGFTNTLQDLKDTADIAMYRLPQQLSATTEQMKSNEQKMFNQHKDYVAIKNIENQENRAQETYDRYSPYTTSGTAMQILGDLAENVGYNAPYQILGAIPGVGTGLSTAARFAGSMTDAYGQARVNGATREQAGLASVLEGANQGIGELALGGINGAGKSLALKAATKGGLKIARPLMKTALNAVGSTLEEGFEEVEQDIISYFIEKTYNPDAKLNAKDLAYSGLLGALTAAPNAVISAPSHYSGFKADADLINSYIQTASSVMSESDADATVETGNNIIKQCDEWIEQSKEVKGEAGKEMRSRAESIKESIQNTQKTLNDNKETVIKSNTSKNEALNKIANDSVDNIVKNTADLVDVVSDGNNTKKNDINATIDYLVGKRNEFRAEIETAIANGDEQEAQRQYANFMSAQKAIETLRNQRSEVQAERSKAETNGNVTSENNTARTSENQQAVSEQKQDTVREKILKDAGFLGVNEDIDTAADEAVKEYGGMRNAVDAVMQLQKELSNSTDMSDAEKQETLGKLRDINRSIRNRNTARMQSYTNAMTEVLKKYGVKDVEIMDVESDSVRNSTKVNGYYDPKSKKIFISPYIDEAQAAGAVVVHEFTHHGATADGSLVSDIIKAKNTLVDKGEINGEMFSFDKYAEAYKGESDSYITSEDGKAEVSSLISSGMTEEEAKAKAVENYVNEEIAAHFMQEIMRNDNALNRLAKEDRPLLKRILDTIVNFFSRKDARNRRMAELAADKIRAVLKDVEGVEVGNPKIGKNNPQAISRENAEIGNTSTGRRFSLTHETEESGDLIAVHNVDTGKLQKILKIGGMPMPSIAVTKLDIGHGDFGDVSLVFGVETVDPSANKANKIYSADVYSPLFPSFEYEVNKDAANKIKGKYQSIKEKSGIDVARVLQPYFSANALELELNRRGGVEGLVEWLSNDTNMMNAFLADTGKEPVKMVVKEVRTELSQSQREMGQYLIDTLGEDVVKEYAPRMGENAIAMRKRWFADHENQVRNALKQYYTENGIDAETAQSLVDNTKNAEIVSSALKPAKSILYGNADTVRTETDYIATQEKIAEAAKGDEYEAWLNDLFDGVVKTEGIPNGKDPYTPSGNRRSFSATHYPVTLDNIVKAMRGKGDVKGAETSTENARAIRSASADEFKSIADVKANENRLKAITEEEAKAQWDSFDERLYNIINSMMNTVKKIDDRLIEERRIGWVIAEASRNPTTENIRNMLQKYGANDKWFNFTEENISEIQSLVNDIRTAPSDIFEAKPERVVSLNEIKYAVVPDDLSKETVRSIANKGIEVRTYESGNEESRLETLNKLDNVRFSKDVGTDSNSRYDYSKSFAEQIDDYINGKIPKYDTLVVGKTPEVFQKIGLNPLPMTYGTGHLKEVLNGTKEDHDFGIEVLKKVPEALESPVAILASKTKPDSSIVAILDLSSENKPLFAAVEIDGYGQMNKERVDANAITSIHERSNAVNQILNAITNDSDTSNLLFYVDKEKTVDLLNASGVQFPGGKTVPNGFVHSIHDNGSPVKGKFRNVTQTKQFKRWFGDWETHPEGASKVVNKDGTPKVVYHYTNGDFTVFNTNASGSNQGKTHGDGIYVSTSPTEFKYAGKNRMELYADIKNPFEMELTPEQADYILDKYASKKHDLDAYDGMYREHAKSKLTAPSRVFDYLNEYAKDNNIKTSDILSDLGYDGVHDGSEWIAFSPEQVKSATDNIGIFDPNNPDIRYSKEVFTSEERQKLISQGQLDYLKRQFVSMDKTGNYAKSLPLSARNKIAKMIIGKMGSSGRSVSTNDAVAALTSAFKAIDEASGKTPEERFDNIYKAVEKSAVDIANMVRDENINPMYTEYEDLRKILRETKLNVSDVKSDIADFNDWRKAHMGVLKLGNDGLAVDTLYQELAHSYPELFPDNIVNASDQLERIGDVSVMLKKQLGNPITSSENYDATVADMTRAVIAAYEQGAQTTLAAKNKQLQSELSVQEKQTARIMKAYASSVDKMIKEFDAADAKISYLQNKISENDARAKMEVDRKKAKTSISRLTKMLRNPSRKEHMPEHWRDSVQNFVDSVGDSDDKNRVAGIDDVLSKMQEYKESIASDVSNGTNGVKLSVNQVDNLTSVMSNLRSMIESGGINEKGHGYTFDISKSKYNAYVSTVAEAAASLESAIRNENTILVNEKTVAANEFAQELISQINKRGKTFDKTGSEKSGFRKWFSDASLDLAAPEILFHSMGKNGDEIANSYRTGQNAISKHKNEYVAYMKKVLGDSYSTERNSVRGDLVDVEIGGKNFKVSKQQLMSIHLLWNRAAGRQHLENGGAFFLNRNGEQQSKESVVITEDVYNSLMSKLSKEEIRIAEATQKFLANECAEWGNEVSMQLYGYRMYNDRDYFPIAVSKDYTQTDLTRISDNHRLENIGFTKQLQRSKLPVYIRDIFDVADKHVEDMAMYNGYVPTNNMLERVYNSSGVKTAISEQYGKNGIKYVEDFLRRANGITGSRGGDTSFMTPSNFMENTAKKTAVAFNLSTGLKQPLSYLRASTEIEYKYLAKAATDSSVFSPKKYAALFDEMNEHSGIAKIKSLGYSDVGFGQSVRSQYDEQNFASAYNKTKYAWDKFEDASMWFAGKMDEATWVRLWNACKMKINDENPSLSDSEKMKLVTRKFNQVIGRTQVVDSILDTAPISYDTKFKLLNPFMNEPVKTAANLLYTYQESREAKKGIEGKESGKFGKALTSFVVTNIVLEPLISSMIGVWRDKEDEDPEEYLKKVFTRWTGLSTDDREPTSFTSVFTSEVIDGIFSFPFVGTVYDVMSNVLKGYSSDSMPVSAMYDLFESGMKLYDRVIQGNDGQKSTFGLTMEFISSVAQATGIPATTIRRDLNAALRTVLNASKNALPGSNLIRWNLNKLYYNLDNKSARSKKYFYDILSDAYANDDKEVYYKLRDELKEINVDSSEVTKAIEKNGGEIQPGTKAWRTELQAQFSLPSAGNERVDRAIESVYVQCSKIQSLDEAEAIPNTPGKYSYKDANGNKVEMTDIEYSEFVENVGVMRYKLCAELTDSNNWSKLNAEQKLYALGKAYDFAARYYRQKFNEDYSSGDKWMRPLYGKSLNAKEVANTIIGQAFEK